MKNPEFQQWPDGTRVRFTQRAQGAMRRTSMVLTPLSTPELGPDVVYTIDNTPDSFHDVTLRETRERYGVAWLELAGVNESLAGKIRAALQGEGLDSGGASPHSWRCEHPDRYGHCTCLDEAVSAVLLVVQAHQATNQKG